MTNILLGWMAFFVALTWFCGTLESATSPLRRHADWLGPLAFLAAVACFVALLARST